MGSASQPADRPFRTAMRAIGRNRPMEPLLVWTHVGNCQVRAVLTRLEDVDLSHVQM